MWISHIIYILIGRVAMAVPRRSRFAESCTHPAKRDRCFPPPIAERQRLPNVGIICIGDSFALHFPRFGRSWTAAPKLALGPCLIYDTRQTKEGRQAAEPAYSKVFMLWFSSNAGNSYWVALPGTSMSLERSWTTLDKSCPVSGLGKDCSLVRTCMGGDSSSGAWTWSDDQPLAWCGLPRIASGSAQLWCEGERFWGCPDLRRRQRDENADCGDSEHLWECVLTMVNLCPALWTAASQGTLLTS